MKADLLRFLTPTAREKGCIGLFLIIHPLVSPGWLANKRQICLPVITTTFNHQPCHLKLMC